MSPLSRVGGVGSGLDAGRGEGAACFAGDSFVDHLAVDRSDALGVLGEDPAGLLHRRGAGCERYVDRADLGGVNGGLGGEAERHRGGDLLRQAGVVMEIEKRRVDRRYAAQSASRDQSTTCEGEWLPCGGRPEVCRHIGRAQHQAEEPRRGGSNRLRRGEATRALDQADESRAFASRGQQTVEDLKVASRLRLGQHQKVGRGLGAEQRV